MATDGLTGRIRSIIKLLIAYKKEARSAQAFHNALAASAKMHSTDLVCMDFLLQHGPSTAGELTSLTGLTTGAMTNVIDRMERAGYVRRETDKKDRRKVLVKAVSHKLKRVIAMQSTHADHMQKLLTEYSLEELAIITDFLENSAALHEKEAQHLK